MPISNPSLPSLQSVPEGLKVEDLTPDALGLTLTARISTTGAVCPRCGQHSAWVHSANWRSLKDLP